MVQLADGRIIWFSPDDDTVDAFLTNIIRPAQKSIHIADYSFNLDVLVDVLIQKYHEGVDVKLVLDRSQSKGITEIPEVARLKTVGINYVVGTSFKHQIMHDKYAVVDGYCSYGSWNYTKVAGAESNFLVYDPNPVMTQAFASNWSEQYTWISQNEPQIAP